MRINKFSKNIIITSMVFGAMVLNGTTSSKAGETTTGNATGVVMKLNSEWVAVGNLTKATNYYNSALRYKNVYKESIDSGNSLKYIKMIGDAITETQNWYGGSATFMYRRNL